MSRRHSIDWIPYKYGSRRSCNENRTTIMFRIYIDRRKIPIHWPYTETVHRQFRCLSVFQACGRMIHAVRKWRQSHSYFLFDSNDKMEIRVSRRNGMCGQNQYSRLRAHGQGNFPIHTDTILTDINLLEKAVYLTTPSSRFSHSFCPSSAKSTPLSQSVGTRGQLHLIHNSLDGSFFRSWNGTFPHRWFIHFSHWTVVSIFSCLGKFHAFAYIYFSCKSG